MNASSNTSCGHKPFNGGRPAPSTCVICQDYLLMYDSSGEEDEDTNGGGNERRNSQETLPLVPIVATKCGHLFHTQCINLWFMEKRKQEWKPCPFCAKEMRSNDLKRIFIIN